MIGLILMVAAFVAAGFAFKMVGEQVEARVKGYTHSATNIGRAKKAAETVGVGTASAVLHGWNGVPRVLAAFASTACAFVVLAVAASVAIPPQGEFHVGNVDWATRDGGLFGLAADAVLVRTAGASVESGLMYSTATLSGQTYVSFFGSPWIATDAPGTLATVAYAVLALMGGFIGVTVSRAAAAADRHPATAAPAAG